MFLFGACCIGGDVAAATSSGFAPIPAAAVTHLGSSRGKPIRSGIVFVGGHYLKPPYVVKRMGTGIFIRDGGGRDWQVTGQVRRWTAFLATQGGLGADDEESVDDFFSEKDEDGGAKKPAKVEDSKDGAVEVGDNKRTTTSEAPVTGEKKEAETEEKKEAETEEKKEAVAEGKKEAESGDRKEETARPFEHNARSRALLKTIDDFRRRLDKALRLNAMLLFSPSRRYLQIDARAAVDAVDAIATGMKKDGDAHEMAQRMRARGLSLFGSECCEEFLKHRADYPTLQECVRKMRDEAETRRMLNGVDLSR